MTVTLPRAGGVNLPFDISNAFEYLSDRIRVKERGMGVEGREKQKILEAGALALSGQLGATVQRLRKAYNLSLSELSQQSGVAKSIISQIERNETNPTLATIWRLAQALDVSIERVLQTTEDEPFLEKTSRADTPILVSDDGKCRLAIIGWIKTVDWLQCYDFSADPGGLLESEAHQRGSVESLSLREGELEVEVAGARSIVRSGETLRYRCDRPHVIRNIGTTMAQGTMVCILKAAAME
jgi:transcriptional regulator with XRE-family HTH domain